VRKTGRKKESKAGKKAGGNPQTPTYLSEMRTWRTWRTSKMQNFNCIFEGEGLLYGISRQNNLESPPRD
jgi:hypothetical protein